jgi:hypothetical protein
MDPSPHPNWRALASVSFHRKIFIKATEIEENRKKVEKERQNSLKGSEVKAFYESVLCEPSTSSVKYKGQNGKKTKKIIREKSEKIVAEKKTFKVLGLPNIRHIFIRIPNNFLDLLFEYLLVFVLHL